MDESVGCVGLMGLKIKQSAFAMVGNEDSHALFLFNVYLTGNMYNTYLGNEHELILVLVKLTTDYTIYYVLVAEE